MNVETQTALAAYVVLLMKEGFKALPVGTLIPTPFMPGAPKRWTQFPKFDQVVLSFLEDNGIFYDNISGWFKNLRG